MNTAIARENWQEQIVDGKFPLLERVGSSERGEVFRTRLSGPGGQSAAVKLISADVQNAEDMISRWRLAATLTHPHLLRIFHVGRCSLNNARLLYVVSEWADEDLSQVLPIRPLSSGEAGEMLKPAIDALSYLHARGLVHGRIKPSNIMAIDNLLKLSSDSIHRIGESEVQAVAPGPYDAPEVTRGATSPAADVWSLGIVLVEALSQRKPAWESAGQSEPSLPGPLPSPFRHIARECLRRNPNDRCTLDRVKAAFEPGPAQPETWRDTRPDARPLTPKPSGINLKFVVPVAAVLALGTVFVWKVATRQPQPPASPAATETREPSSSTVPPAATRSSESTVAPQGASTPADVAERFIPDIPLSARETVTGKVRVVVQVAVNPAGEVSNTTLLSPGPSRYFANKAIDASRRWKFRPALVNGQPVAGNWALKFLFGRAGTEVFPTPVR